MQHLSFHRARDDRHLLGAHSQLTVRLGRLIEVSEAFRGMTEYGGMTVNAAMMLIEMDLKVGRFAPK